MFKYVLPFVFAVWVVAVRPALSQQTSAGYADRAEMDGQGNVYVSSGDGRLITMAGPGYCAEVITAADNQTVGCSITKTSDLEVRRLEIFLRGGVRKAIDLDAPVAEWRFWNNGRQVAVHYGPRSGAGTYALYDSATGNVVEKLAEPPEEKSLPQWAKGAGQIQDESVPEIATLNQDRTKWIAKVMRRIGTLQPGMKRSDLSKLFTTEGGLSTRDQRVYVIETISLPYLQWSISD